MSSYDELSHICVASKSINHGERAFNREIFCMVRRKHQSSYMNNGKSAADENLSGGQAMRHLSGENMYSEKHQSNPIYSEKKSLLKMGMTMECGRGGGEMGHLPVKLCPAACVMRESLGALRNSWRACVPSGCHWLKANIKICKNKAANISKISSVVIAQ